MQEKKINTILTTPNLNKRNYLSNSTNDIPKNIVSVVNSNKTNMLSE